MRIIAGLFRGRKLSAPSGQNTRPTSDRLRESIFSSLTHHFEGGLSGLFVGDIFAGTGAMGLEALSRGAKGAIFVEKHEGLKLIRENAQNLKCEAQCQFLSADARTLPPITQKLDLIFLDPPYGRGLAEPALQSALTNGWLKKASIAIVELSADDQFNCPEGFCVIKEKTTTRSKVVWLEVV